MFFGTFLIVMVALFFDWSHLPTAIGSIAGTVAILQAMGKFSEWIGKRFAHWVGEEIDRRLKSPEAMSELSIAISRTEEFQRGIRHGVRNAMQTMAEDCEPCGRKVVATVTGRPPSASAAAGD